MGSTDVPVGQEIGRRRGTIRIRWGEDSRRIGSQGPRHTVPPVVDSRFPRDFG